MPGEARAGFFQEPGGQEGDVDGGGIDQQGGVGGGGVLDGEDVQGGGEAHGQAGGDQRPDAGAVARKFKRLTKTDEEQAEEEKSEEGPKEGNAHGAHVMGEAGEDDQRAVAQGAEGNQTDAAPGGRGGHGGHPFVSEWPDYTSKGKKTAYSPTVVRMTGQYRRKSVKIPVNGGLAFLFELNDN